MKTKRDFLEHYATSAVLFGLIQLGIQRQRVTCEYCTRPAIYAAHKNFGRCARHAGQGAPAWANSWGNKPVVNEVPR